VRVRGEGFRHPVAMPTRNDEYYRVPGPGTYVHETTQRGAGRLGDAPMYSLSPRSAVPKAAEISPGPIYSTRVLTPRSEGSFGDQSAKFGFGTQGRLGTALGVGPGPGSYTSHTSIGLATKIGIGTARQREYRERTRGNCFVSESHASKSNYGMHSPGPLHYTIEDNGATGNLSSRSVEPNSPRYSMRARLSDPANATNRARTANQTPAPSAYTKPSSFGGQTQSGNPSSSAFSSGNSCRETPEDNIHATPFAGKGHARENLGVHSPGPCKYETRTKRGSRDPAAPGFSFGSEGRF